MLRGLTFEEYADIICFVNKFHRFGIYLGGEKINERNSQYMSMHAVFGSGHLNIKYIDNCFDTRDQTIWSITFRQGRFGVRFATNHFAGKKEPKNFKYESLHELCMDYLQGRFTDIKDFEVEL